MKQKNHGWEMDKQIWRAFVNLKIGNIYWRTNSRNLSRVFYKIYGVILLEIFSSIFFNFFNSFWDLNLQTKTLITLYNRIKHLRIKIQYYWANLFLIRFDIFIYRNFLCQKTLQLFSKFTNFLHKVLLGFLEKDGKLNISEIVRSRVGNPNPWSVIRPMFSQFGIRIRNPLFNSGFGFLIRLKLASWVFLSSPPFWMQRLSSIYIISFKIWFYSRMWIIENTKNINF